VRGVYNAMLQGDRAAAAMLQRAGSGFSTDRELENYRTQVAFVPAKLVLATVITADLKWKYDWEEVRFTESTASVATKTNGLNKTNQGWAYNWNELANTGTLWAPLGLPSNVPAGFKLQPIASGTPVLLFPVRDTTGALFWVFDKVNAIDGVCP
jgi:hypothetical protein